MDETVTNVWAERIKSFAVGCAVICIPLALFIGALYWIAGIFRITVGAAFVYVSLVFIVFIAIGSVYKFGEFIRGK